MSPNGRLVVRLPHKFKPFPHQLRAMRAIDRGFRYILLNWSRRQGKDMWAVNEVCRQAIKRRGQYFYMFPYAKQAKKAIFEGFTNDGEKIIDYIPKSIIKKVRRTECQIELINGSIIEFIGSDEAEDKLAGTNPAGVVFSEAGISREEAWTVAVRPIIRANKGWVLFVSTLRGKNWFYHLIKMGIHHPEWWVDVRDVIDTGLMTPREILAELATVPNRRGIDKMLQELFNIPQKNTDTSYFIHELEGLKKQGRIALQNYNPRNPVYTFWDIGLRDKNAIWFIQFKNGNPSTGEPIVLHYYENTQRPVHHYCDYILCLPFRYGGHFMPHDGGRRQFTDEKLRTVADIAEEEGGLEEVEVVERTSDINLDIEHMRKVLPKCLLNDADRGVKQAIDYMEQYHEKTQRHRESGEMIRMGKPEHDVSSNCADGFRTFSNAYEQDIIEPGFIGDDDGEELQRYALF